MAGGLGMVVEVKVAVRFQLCKRTERALQTMPYLLQLSRVQARRPMPVINSVTYPSADRDGTCGASALSCGSRFAAAPKTHSVALFFCVLAISSSISLICSV